MRGKNWLVILALAVAVPLIGRAQELNLSPTYAGAAVALQATQTGGSSVSLADTGPIPPTGGTRQASLPYAVAGPRITALQLYAVTLGSGGQNRSQASLAACDFSLGNHRVTAQWIEANATARAEFLGVVTSGTVTVNSLTIDGSAITVSGAANQTIELQDGYVIINEQTVSGGTQSGAITVNAIHFVVRGVGSVIAASATAKVINQPTRNAAAP